MATLVFVHGSGCTGEVFAAQSDAFPGSLAVTLPGHTIPGEPSSIAEMADAVATQCEERSIDDAVIVGNSMGGAIALELALRRDPHVRAIALLGSGAKLRVGRAIFDAIAADFPSAARMLAGYFFSEPPESSIAWAVAEMLRVGAPQTARDFHACDSFDVTGRLSEIALPVLALTGERDVMTPPRFAALIADRVPGATARIVAGAGHLVMVERPNDTNEALRAFVTGIVA
ncbi:MAG: alpha/beta hydrolase [Candidatus Eremiobacteraeota bacterium]|nr:alpha/beta hydrolase [Candidatus Eremiobacteraeota bacterium]